MKVFLSGLAVVATLLLAVIAWELYPIAKLSATLLYGPGQVLAAEEAKDGIHDPMDRAEDNFLKALGAPPRHAAASKPKP